MAVTATSLLQKKEIVGRFEAVYLFFFHRQVDHALSPTAPALRCNLRALPFIPCAARTAHQLRRARALLMNAPIPHHPLFHQQKFHREPAPAYARPPA